MGDQYDIFFSYAHADKEAVKPLLAALHALDLRIFQDVENIPTGASISQRIEHGLGNARMLTAWYSKTYPTRLACQWELTAALIATQQDASSFQAVEHRILALNPELDNSHIQPVHVRDRRCLNVRDNDPDRIARDVAMQLGGLKGHFSEIRVMDQPTWFGSNMRLSSNRFVGRIPDLWAIHSGLSKPNFAASNGGGVGLVQVQGMGASAKHYWPRSTLFGSVALYPGGVFWLNASNSAFSNEAHNEMLSTQLLRFANHLGIETSSPTSDQVASFLRSKLATCGRYLWVVDDLPPEAGYDVLLAWSSPTKNGATIVTTRSRKLKNFGVFYQLDVLPPGDAYNLLISHCAPRTEVEEDLAKGILSFLGNHALAIDVTGAALKFEGYKSMHDLLRSPQEDALEVAIKLADELPCGHAPSIAATLLASISRLNADGLRLLQLAAWLASAPIPQMFIADVFSILIQDESVGRRQTALGIKAVTEESLAKYESGPDSATNAVLVHMLVSRTVNFHFSKDLSILDAAVIALATHMVEANDVRNHAVLLPLVPHARTITNQVHDEWTALLLLCLGRLNFERAEYDVAEVDVRRAIAEQERILGEEHPDTLKSVNNLAEIIVSKGDLKGALKLHESGLEKSRRVNGDEHPDTLNFMNNIAAIKWQQGQYADARQIEEQTLETTRRIKGDDHPDTLTSMNNLASTLKDLSEYESARILEEKTLEIRCQHQGDDHPDTLTAKNNLATTLWMLGNNQQSIKILEHVLCERQRVLGHTHPDTLRSMISLACVIKSTGNFKEARNLEEVAIVGLKDTLGSDHHDTLLAINNFSVTMFNLGDLNKSKILIKEALLVAIEKYGLENKTSQALIAWAQRLGLPVPFGVK